WLLLHSFIAVATEHELLDVPLSGRFVGAYPAPNLPKRFLNDAMHFVGSVHLHLVLSRRKNGFESLHQFRASDRFDTKRADELNGSGIDSRDVGDVIHGRILHGNAAL